MQLIWYGLSCFLLKSNSGKRILINPFENILYYRDSIPYCDLIISSTPDINYTYLNIIDSRPKIIDKTGLFDLGFCKIEGINSYQDNLNGLKRGPNIINIISIDDFSICNLGYLGHIPNDTILQKLTNVDFLLIPIGGHFTLDGFNAAKVCNMIYPKYIIPMHYKTNTTSLILYDCKDFILSFKNKKIMKYDILDTSEERDFENESKIILLLDHKLN